MTKLKATQEGLRISEIRYRRLFEAARDGILILDAVTLKITDVNPFMMDLLDYSRAEFLGKELWEIGLFSDKEASQAVFQELQATGYLRYEDLPLQTKEGKLRQVEFISNVYEEDAQQVIQCNIRDITDHKRAEEKLRQNESQLAEAQRMAHVGSWIWDLLSNTMMWSDEHYRILGLRPGEIDPTNEFVVAKYIHPEDRDLVRNVVEQSLRTLEPLNFHYRVIQPDGSVRVIHSRGNVTSDEQGNPVRIFGTAQDVTELKHAEQELRASEERYRDLIENAHDIIYTHDLEGNYTSVNKASEKITGYTKEESLRMNLAQTIAPEYLEKARQMLAKKIAGEETTAYDLEITAKDGHRIAVEVNTRIIIEERIPVGVQGIARDITERKQLEDQLRQSQKMEAIGQLAGGVAHDFNNLLTAIIGYSELSLRKLKSEDPLHRNLEEIRKAGERAASLTRQLLAFSRKQVLQPKILYLNAIISELEKMLHRLIGEIIELRTVLETGLGSVKADPGQIEQVILNLVINARDAMPAGGKLLIETENVSLSEDYAGQHIAVAPGSYVMLAVSDTGTGMDEKTKARIFEPFFTTKELGKGTGLGLSIVYGIVKQSGGSIWVYSEVGRGTTFKVYLPRVDEGAQEYKQATETEEKLQGTETILLAEDEEMVRALAHEILETYGYQVLEAANGGTALLICEQHPEPIHLLITDVVMPEMSGRELSDRLSQLRPEMKVLFMSGYTDAIVHQEVLDEDANFIQKPFTPNAVLRKVREVLNARGVA